MSAIVQKDPGTVRQIDSCLVDAFDMASIQDSLTAILNKTGEDDLLFNLTGGTKPMSIAAFQTAANLGAPIIYFQTEGMRSRVRRYNFENSRLVISEDTFLPTVITLNEYLTAHVDLMPDRKPNLNDYGHQFQDDVFRAVQGMVDEARQGISIHAVVDLDIAIRKGNQVGVIEVKSGKNGIKHAIDQLNTAAEPRFLGTYTRKILVSDQDLNKTEASDRLNLANAQNLTVISLSDYTMEAGLSDRDLQILRSKITTAIG